jgi:hypothetical protein
MGDFIATVAGWRRGGEGSAELYRGTLEGAAEKAVPKTTIVLVNVAAMTQRQRARLHETVSGRGQAQRQAPRGGSCPTGTDTRISTTHLNHANISSIVPPLELPTTRLPFLDCASFHCEPRRPMIPYSETLSTPIVTRPTSLPPPLSPIYT